MVLFIITVFLRSLHNDNFGCGELSGSDHSSIQYKSNFTRFDTIQSWVGCRTKQFKHNAFEISVLRYQGLLRYHTVPGTGFTHKRHLYCADNFLRKRRVIRLYVTVIFRIFSILCLASQSIKLSVISINRRLRKYRIVVDNVIYLKTVPMLCFSI